MAEMLTGAALLLIGFAGGFNMAVILAARGRMDDDG